MACSADGAHITALNLVGFNLRGELPAEIAALGQLTRLDFSRNLLYGAAPAALPYARCPAWHVHMFTSTALSVVCMQKAQHAQHAHAHAMHMHSCSYIHM